MANLNYLTDIAFDLSLKNVGTNEEDLIVNGEKITAGAPNATTGRFTAGCLIQNSADGSVWLNTGSTAAPVWTAVSGGGFSYVLKGSVTAADVNANAGSGVFTLPIVSSYGGLAVVGVMIKLTEVFDVDDSNLWQASIIDTISLSTLGGTNGILNSRITFASNGYIANTDFNIEVGFGMFKGIFSGGNTTGNLDVYVMLA